MNPKMLAEAFEHKKEYFYTFINHIKSHMRVDLFSIINPTLIINPYNTNFPKKFFLQEYTPKNRVFLFFNRSFKFYAKQFYFFITYFMSFILFKIYYKKSELRFENYLAIDVFFLVDNINATHQFQENYFTGLYDILDKYHTNYVFLPRLYGVHKNPLKLIKFFKIINEDKRNFLFEFELLSFKDFLSILLMIVLYPFKTLRLKQQEDSAENRLFNNELINDIGTLGSEVFSRFIYGKNVANVNQINHIYSWSEFQVIERSFNYGVRTSNDEIKLHGCQFYLNYETYFNAYIHDIDFKQKTSYHEILVNGQYYLQDRNHVKYRNGVSLRYKKLFSFSKTEYGKNILLLGSYIESDTKYMLSSLASFDHVLFKNHPAINIHRFGQLTSNIAVVENNIYTLFKNVNIVIGTASGSSVEAVACGVSVIIIASQNNLTANPLVEYGKGKIWDIAFSSDDVKKMYNQLTEYRNNNMAELQKIALWYRNNFFIEPTEQNILKAFDIEIKGN